MRKHLPPSLARAVPFLDELLRHMKEHDTNLPPDAEKQLLTAFSRRQISADDMRIEDIRLRLFEMLDHPLYCYVAVRYLEMPTGGPGFDPAVKSEFKDDIARLYGKNTFSPFTMGEDRQAFWNGFAEAVKDV